MNYKFYHNLVAGVEAESRQRQRHQVAGATIMTNPEPVLEVAKVRNDALEEAARVCDWLCKLESQVDSQIARHRAEATENAAVRIRGLKDPK